MDRISNILKKIREDNRLTTLTVAILGVCLLVVVGLFFAMPGAKAAAYSTTTETMTVTNGRHMLTSLTDGTDTTVTTATLGVTDGNSYIIDGEGIQKTNVSLTVNYTGTTGSASNPAKVYINLVNINMAQTVDVSAIKFTTGGNAVDYIVTIEGDCSVTSTCRDAYQPLLAVEDTSYELYRLKKATGSAPYTIDDYLITETVSKQVNLVLQGATAVSSLSLTNGVGSYGALIGTSESKTFADESAVERNALIATLNGQVISEGEITITDNTIVAQLIAEYNFTTYNNMPNVFQPQYKYKSANGITAGNIVIGGIDGTRPLEIKLTNNGYGAAIGGGGNALSSGKGANSGRVTVNAGTITVNTPTTEYNSPVFGSGIAKGSTTPASTYGTTGGIEINGGSIWFGAHANKFGNDLPVNKNGNRVYEVKVNTESSGGASILDVGTMEADTSLALTYEYDTSLQFDLELERITSNRVVDAGTYKYLDVDVMLNIPYSYEGTGHESNKMLGFWLPATETATLVITDEFGPGYSKFTVVDSAKNVIKPISDDETSANSRRYVLVKGNTYYIKISNIPAGLSVTRVTLNSDSGTTAATYNAASGYRVVAADKNIEAVVTYGGKIDVVYDKGILPEDEANHEIVMPMSDYEYGTEILELDNLGTINKDSVMGGSVPDLIFNGWMYTDAAGNELGHITHITKSSQQDGNQRVYSDIVQPDGKIYLKAKWLVQVEYVIGAEATMTGGVPTTIKVEYGYGTGNVMDVAIPNQIPFKELYAFTGWSVDDGEELFNYNTSIGALNSISLSSLTSHALYANYERSGFSVFIDKASLNEDFAKLQCIGSTGTDILVKNADGSLATTVIDGKTYYYTGIVRKDSQIRVVISTVRGYKMENCNVSINGSTKSKVTIDSVTGECLADFTVENSDVYVSSSAVFKPISYEITFKDGKEPNELLWGEYTFTYDIEDIEAGKTIGDIIRDGLGMSQAQLSDTDIALYVNSIDKNTRFTDFSGWNNVFCAETLDSSATIASIFEDNSNLTWGDLTFTANWTEYDKYAINVNLFEREFLENGLYEDKESDNLTAVLYYYTDGSKRVPVYTEEVIDDVTGEETTVAYAKAGDKIEMVLYRKNQYGRPYGQPVSQGIITEQLYYEYESKVNENVHADVKDGSLSFVVKSDVKDETVIEVYLSVSLKKYIITYWDVRGFDNSANPNTYTIFDEFDFVPITDGVDWLLICPDTDDTNNDDITTEVIEGIRQNGKLVTDGVAGNRDYVANLVLKPDWSVYREDSYNIDIRIENDAFGQIKIIYPSSSEGYYANDTIFLSVVPKEGYKLVPNSLVYRKENSPALMFKSSARLMSREVDTIIIPVVDQENGTYLFIMPGSDIVVTAEFELCQYDIIYSDITADTTNPNPKSYNINSEIVLSDPVRDGYKFLGWYDEAGNQIFKITGRTGNLVLTPVFELEEADVEPGDTDKPADDADKPADDTDKPTGDSDTDDNQAGKPSDGNSVTITGRPSNVVSRPSNVTINGSTPGSNSSNLQTGDQTNIPKIILICVAAVLVLMIVVIKKPKNEDEENNK